MPLQSRGASANASPSLPRVPILEPRVNTRKSLKRFWPGVGKLSAVRWLGKHCTSSQSQQRQTKGKGRMKGCCGRRLRDEAWYWRSSIETKSGVIKKVEALIFLAINRPETDWLPSRSSFSPWPLHSFFFLFFFFIKFYFYFPGFTAKVDCLLRHEI